VGRMIGVNELIELKKEEKILDAYNQYLADSYTPFVRRCH
jgi:hypothetical protein